MKKQTNKNKREHRSHFTWAVSGILVVLFLMFFINGYLVNKQTGIDDQDITVFQ